MTLPIEIERHMPEIEAEIIATGSELIELQFRRSGSRSFLTFLVDRPGGITLDECVQVNRKISALFDAYELAEPQSFFQTPYSLEVNSPGLDRPLKTEKDFKRVMGERVRIWGNDSEGKSKMWVAHVRSADPELLELEEKNGNRLIFRWVQVMKAIRDL